MRNDGHCPIRRVEHHQVISVAAGDPSAKEHSPTPRADGWSRRLEALFNMPFAIYIGAYNLRLSDDREIGYCTHRRLTSCREFLRAKRARIEPCWCDYLDVSIRSQGSHLQP